MDSQPPSIPPLPPPSRRLGATTQPIVVDPLAYQRAARERAAARRQRAAAAYRWMPPADSRPTVPAPPKTDG